MSDAKPAYSLILEWDNARDRIPQRLRRVLTALAREVRSVDQPAELLALFDPLLVTPEQAAASIEEGGLAQLDQLVIRAIPGPHLRYYELKNLGAQSARSEQLVFLDSDVIPGQGWLRAHLQALAHASGGLVAGYSHIETTGVYAKAVALAWVFDAPGGPEAGPASRRRFMANNFSSGRGLLLEVPFPPAGSQRGACDDVARGLRDRGLDIVFAPSAIGAHPPPPLLMGFLSKAWAEGRDRSLRWLARGIPWHRRLSWPLEFWAKSLWRSAKGIVLRRRDAQLSLLGVPLAVLIMWVFWTLAFVAASFTMLTPALGRRVGPQ